MEVLKEKPAAGNWEKFSAINKRGELGAYKQKDNGKMVDKRL
jgi:adenosine deaminase/adenosine deaminase CECR1